MKISKTYSMRKMKCSKSCWGFICLIFLTDGRNSEVLGKLNSRLSMAEDRAKGGTNVNFDEKMVGAVTIESQEWTSSREVKG